jgi:DNA polymerase-3 subunit delta
MKKGLTYSAAAKMIDSAATPLCLFLYGPEDYLKEDLAKRAESKLIGPGLKGFNYSTYDLAETPLAEALGAAESFPALGGARVVLIRNAQRLSRSKRDRALLHARLATPPDFLALLLIAGDIDAKAGILNDLPESVRPVHLKVLGEREVHRWLSSKASAIGLKLSPDAARALLDLTGGSMWQLSNELEKLRANVGDGGEALEADVHSLVPGSYKRSPFALTNAIRSGDRAVAAELVSELLERGESPVGLTALISSQVIRGWASVAGRVAGGGMPAGDVRRRLLLLCETDSCLKRSKVEPSTAAHLLVDALTRRGR